jgi:hypothetical protein
VARIEFSIFGLGCGGKLYGPWFHFFKKFNVKALGSVVCCEVVNRDPLHTHRKFGGTTTRSQDP